MPCWLTHLTYLDSCIVYYSHISTYTGLIDLETKYMYSPSGIATYSWEDK